MQQTPRYLSSSHLTYGEGLTTVKSFSSPALLSNHSLQAASAKDPQAAQEILALHPSLDSREDLDAPPEPAGISVTLLKFQVVYH